jgi:ribonuclease HII
MPAQDFQLKPFYKLNTLEAGCDEAGRGCLAGPVFAAAVVLPPDYTSGLLNDSKQLSEKTRNKLRTEIEKEAIAYAIGIVGHEVIDKVNILNASILAMHSALNQLSVAPQHIIVDGNRFKPFGKTPHTCIVKGDSLYFSIAAASVLAKTYRDQYMLEAHKKYPGYGWSKNKGYPTKVHREAILKYGLSPIHRRSFATDLNQLSLDFSQ